MNKQDIRIRALQRTARAALTAMSIAAAGISGAWAHGDVTPQAVDTS